MLKRKNRKTRAQHWQQATAMKVTRIHFPFVAIYMLSLIIFDSWNLITHVSLAQRWTAVGALLILNTILWYIARMKFAGTTTYTVLLMILVVADIIFASYNVFWDRGIASLAVALFAVPLITAATLRSKSTLLATATFCAAAYVIATMRYFNLHYGEAFRVQLYGIDIFYCALFYVLAFLLWAVLTPEQEHL